MSAALPRVWLCDSDRSSVAALDDFHRTGLLAVNLYGKFAHYGGIAWRRALLMYLRHCIDT